MLYWIPILGGLLIMMGQHDRSEALFYYFRLEDQVPENHLLRLIDKHISFEFVREQLKDSYRKWNSRTRWKNRCMSKNRYRPPTPIPPTPPKVGRRRGWATTTTIWWT